ncbi:MAG: DEAD/DEAH box helicase [Melioribacteraceae bacterium]|nr:MAG: DEAD/DEAH box helicase [Melioribacteraceae bacterium]
MVSFKDLGIDSTLVNAVEELGFVNPMPIQTEVIPVMLNEKPKDIIALAQTGTGKTAAFGLPIIHKTDTRKRNVQYLIISPTRELCLQIADDLSDYSVNNNKISIAAVFGGSSMERQIDKLKRGAQIVSATPGRLYDLIRRNVINLTDVKAVVLDEADEMLNMGFKEDLEAILEATPKQRNTYMFSATMPDQLLKIANKYMNKPIEITIGKKNTGAENVQHISYFVQARDRYLALKRIVDYHPDIYGIVFCRTRQETKEVAEKLIQDGYNAEALHGDLSQQQREVVMSKFRIKHTTLLVATDVAARGLDVDNLTHIINYNLPDELEIYTHRSGRTGRAGKSGTSIIIANLKEKHKIRLIEEKLNKKFQTLQIPSGKEICEKQLFHLIDRVEKVEVDHTNVEGFLPSIYKKLEWMDRTELIQRFVSIEFNRFLDYYKNLPELSSPNEKGRREKDTINKANNYTRFFINVGSRDDIKPTSIIGMIKDYSGVKSIDIGSIEILKNFSFFEADGNYENEILKGFSKQKVKGREINVEVAASKKSEGSRSGDRRDSFKGKRDNKRRSDRFDKNKRPNRSRRKN